jgi:hypothetical protein
MPTTDDFGRGVVFSTDGINDTYAVDGFSVAFPAGTDWSKPFATINAMAPPSSGSPPPVVPATLTRWQAVAQMYATPSVINPAPATLFSDMQILAAATGGLTQLAWLHQAAVHRDGAFIATVAAPLGLTGAHLDALFIAAAQLPA